MEALQSSSIAVISDAGMMHAIDGLPPPDRRPTCPGQT